MRKLGEIQAQRYRWRERAQDEKRPGWTQIARAMGTGSTTIPNRKVRGLTETGKRKEVAKEKGMNQPKRQSEQRAGI